MVKNKRGKRVAAERREERVSGRQESPERERVSGRQKSPERVDSNAGGIHRENSSKSDIASVRTTKSHKSMQRDRVLEVEDQVAELEEQITALEVKQRAVRADLEDRRDHLQFRLEKLKEEFNTMNRNDQDYKSLRAEIGDAEFALRKLIIELSRLEADQKAEKRILQSKLKSAMRKADNEKSQLEDILEEEAAQKSRKALSIPSINSDEKRLQTEDWVNEVLDDVQHIKPKIPTAIEEPCKGASSMSSLTTEQTLCKILARQSIGRDFPIFGGESERWPRFKMEFLRISEECGFSDAEKMSKLEKCLKGEAFRAVQSLMTAPKNVSRVMQRLEQLFGKTELVINALIDKVRQTPPIKENKLEELVDFGIAVGSLTATIEALGDESYLCNPYLVRELEEKLPRDFRLRWMDWIEAAEGRRKTLLCFTEWMDIQTAKVRDLCQPCVSVVQSEKKKTERVNATQAQKPEQKQVKGACNICGKEGHWASNCKFFQNKSLEERKKICHEKRLCASCLYPGHKLSDCRKKKPCGVNGCVDVHNSLLHFQTGGNNNARTISQPVMEHHNKLSGTSGVMLGALPVVIKGPLGSVECIAFLDDGSTGSLIEDDVARKIGLVGVHEPFCMKTMTSVQHHPDSRVVSFTISGAWKKATKYSVNGIRTVGELELEVMKQDAAELKKKWPYLSKLPIPSFNEKPRILLGKSHIFYTVSRQTVGRAPDKPLAFKCKLGWSVGGQQGSKSSTESFFHICESEASDEMLHQLVKNSFSTEDFGVKVSVEKPRSREDLRALEIMKRTTVRVENDTRFQTGLLWKYEDVRLPESKKMALQRLRCQERKMDKDPAFATAYCAKIQEYLDKGFIRKLNPAEISTISERLWYLPHFGVFNPNKPGKLRLVFDAAAKGQGISLNGMLSMGPDLNNPLVSVLWKFRKYSVAIQGDIKDMFHRVFVQPEDRISQRFLWRGTQRDIEPDEYEMLVMIFGATCSPSSAQFTKNLNADEHAKEFPDACKAIKEKFYVDDFLHCAPTEEEIIKIAREVTHVMAEGGFEICNYVSNSKEVLKSIPVELRAKSMNEVDLERDKLPTGRVLGLWWNPTEDEFTFKLIMHKVPKEILEKTRRPTKRDILKVVMSVYDPLGFLGHLVVKGKILQQDVWRSGIGWDDELPTGLNERWEAWLQELKGIEAVKISRCYSRSLITATKVTLHVFCDASEKAFCAITFLRVENFDEVEVSIVSAKTRVTPLKPLSIPRLELQAAVMSSRLSNSIHQEMDIDISSTTFWTDSTTVLRWIRSDARAFKPFIAHRLGEILETTEVHQWRYVPTKLNVADDGTRDTESADLSRGSRWFNGPEFLKKAPEYWPPDIDTRNIPISHEDLEMKVVSVNATREMFQQIDICKFSNLQKLMRVTAYVLRFVHVLKDRTTVKSKLLSVAEIRKAEEFLVKLAQEQSFPEELRFLNEGKKLEKKSRLYQLEPYLCSKGIMRVGGRLARSSENQDFKHPAILCPKNHFTTIVLEWYHRMCGHQGHQTVANEVRQKFWIVSGMTAIKKVFRSCIECQKRNVKLVETKMGDLPDFRVNTQIRPFQHTGLDYFGPMVVKIGRRNEKRWCALFTCLTTRAIHLEVASSLSTDSTIMAIQRFVSRRGVPSHMHSDNGTNFLGTSNEFKQLLKEVKFEDVAEKCSVKGIQWHFNPPAAPHMGGAWERLVLSVKKTLSGILKDVHPTEEVLHSVLLEVESILNSRPLTDVSVDPSDPVCLTPNHFLLGWTGGVEAKDIQQPIWGQIEDYDLYLRKQWRFALHLVDQFWIRWRKEYLPTLTRRKKWLEIGTDVQVGDIVVVVEDVGVRSRWPLGRIVGVFPGQDGVTRVVDVKTAAGIYRRPVSKICRLDVRKEDEVPSSRGRI